MSGWLGGEDNLPLKNGIINTGGSTCFITIPSADKNLLFLHVLPGKCLGWIICIIGSPYAEAEGEQ